jgi:hypothetical protein
MNVTRQPIGHQPTPTEGLERLAHLRAHGPTTQAFGWESLPNVAMWRESRCG